MRWSTLSVVLAGAACLGCEPPSLTQQQRAVEEQFLTNRVSQWTTALNNGTLDTLPEELGARDTLLALYEDSPDVHAIWPDGRYAVGFEAVEQSIADTYSLWEMINYGPISPEVALITAEVGIVEFRHSLDIRFFDTRRQVTSGHTTLVFVKDQTDGLWKIRKQHLSVNPSPSLSGR